MGLGQNTPSKTKNGVITPKTDKEKIKAISNEENNMTLAFYRRHGIDVRP